MNKSFQEVKILLCTEYNQIILNLIIDNNTSSVIYLLLRHNQSHQQKSCPKWIPVGFDGNSLHIFDIQKLCLHW